MLEEKQAFVARTTTTWAAGCELGSARPAADKPAAMVRAAAAVVISATEAFMGRTSD
jgi:hypothetical protein